jgi:hypothetical protein
MVTVSSSQGRRRRRRRRRLQFQSDIDLNNTIITIKSIIFDNQKIRILR